MSVHSGSQREAYLVQNPHQPPWKTATIGSQSDMRVRSGVAFLPLWGGVKGIVTSRKGGEEC